MQDEEKGFYMGLKTPIEEPVLLNFESLKGGIQKENAIFLGTLGHGMAFHANQALTELLNSEEEVIIIDPKAEYQR